VGVCPLYAIAAWPFWVVKHILSNPVVLLLGAEKYRSFMDDNADSDKSIVEFKKDYLMIGRQHGVIPFMTKLEAERFLREKGVPHDISSVPNDALIYQVEVYPGPRNEPLVRVIYEMPN
jgi:hypothetical protein